MSAVEVAVKVDRKSVEIVGSRQPVWVRCGKHEFEWDIFGYTGWWRYADGRLTKGRQMQWNSETGETR